jgi:hypothetical protein
MIPQGLTIYAISYCSEVILVYALFSALLISQRSVIVFYNLISVYFSSFKQYYQILFRLPYMLDTSFIALMIFSDMQAKMFIFLCNSLFHFRSLIKTSEPCNQTIFLRQT